jgi:heme exporter protein A
MVIEAHDLSRRYGRRWALARVELQIPAGERFLIVGANGSGKTTLLRVLSTAIGHSLGTLRLFGLDPESKDIGTIRSRLALLSHLPQVYEDLSARENLDVLFSLMGVVDEAGPYLEKVGLDDRPEPVRSYSAGMRKRLSFARMLAQKPQLALIDEPYGQLDPSGFSFVDSLLTELSELGTTVVVASHHVDRARHLCHRAMLLDKGQCHWVGPSIDIKRAWDARHGSTE